jgi:hypothetical protein
MCCESAVCIHDRRPDENHCCLHGDGALDEHGICLGCEAIWILERSGEVKT